MHHSIRERQVKVSAMRSSTSFVHVCGQPQSETSLLFSSCGRLVGSTVGPGVGDVVGLGVGRLVGLSVGPGVGYVVGLGVGRLVGLRVGPGVGYGVGLGVGLEVSQDLGLHP